MIPDVQVSHSAQELKAEIRVRELSGRLEVHAYVGRVVHSRIRCPRAVVPKRSTLVGDRPRAIYVVDSAHDHLELIGVAIHGCLGALVQLNFGRSRCGSGAYVSIGSCPFCRMDVFGLSCICRHVCRRRCGWSWCECVACICQRNCG